MTTDYADETDKYILAFNLIMHGWRKCVSP